MIKSVIVLNRKNSWFLVVERRLEFKFLGFPSSVLIPFIWLKESFLNEQANAGRKEKHTS